MPARRSAEKPYIGIIGGTGMYRIDDGESERGMQIGKFGGKRVAFLPRHGVGHSIPPHMIGYKENIQKLDDAGVSRLISTTAVGSLREDYRPGDLVITDQFINMTHGRDDTFFHDKVVHVSTAYPYCSELREVAADSAKALGYRFHESGTVVVVNGPRFSTRAESKFFGSMGADIINMTQYPEVALAREKGMCYLNISVITDYDSGIDGKEIDQVSYEEVNRVFEANMEKVRTLLSDIVSKIGNERKCDCGSSLDMAVKG